MKGKKINQKKLRSHENHLKDDDHHDHHNHHQMMVEDFKKRFVTSLVLTIPVLTLSPLIQEFFGFETIFPKANYLLFSLSAIIFFYGGWPFLTGFVKEMKEEQPGMMTLITLAISTAFFYSTAVVFGLEGKLFFWELVTLIDIMLLGHWIEMRSIVGASGALSSLVQLLPSIAHLVKGEEVKDVPLSKLRKGNTVLVKPGEKIPADGIVREGQSNLNESMLTGESKPILKKKDDLVIAGSINGEGSIKVEITATGKKSYLARVIKLVEKAQKSKSKTQDLANRASAYLTVLSISAGITTFLAWIYFRGKIVFALERMVTVMVITCPHALGLAIPLVIAVSTSISAKNGLLIKNRIAFEKAKDLNVIVFDKTGTLTKGDFEVTDIITEWGHDENEVLSFAASLEASSEHPVAKGILKKAKEKNIKTLPFLKFKSLPGKGIQGAVDGKLVQVVGKNYLKEKGVEIESQDIERLLEQGKTTVYVLVEKKLIGAIALADVIREESKMAIKKLKSAGFKCIMLSGDEKKVAQWVASQLDLDSFFAEVLPHQKSTVIKEIQSQGQKVAMVGDGVNDAPSLAQADVGIAIGAGTDVAIESADVILVRSDIRDVVSIVNLAKSTYWKMQQNLFWATGYNLITIPLAAGVLYNSGILLSPATGAILMSLSTIIVAFNAQFLSLKK